ncbi:hypothetical protein SNEBB_007293 [Seison nebaliae]|nr:hypothetical protein SNEBB_007293 [Seison nebaliae]
MTDTKEIQEDVQKYYGDTLKSSKDLRIAGCVITDKLGKNDVALYKSLHEEVREKNYGCGIVYPQFVENCKVIDLGSGSGCDCYMLSKMVGEDGYVAGVDMTPAQIDVARKYVDYHTKLFGFKKPNTNFIQDTIENFVNNKEIEKNFFDVAVSNCVINLVADKKLALQNIYDVLNEGGELYFSDIYANVKLPPLKNTALWGECISGALFWKEFIEMCEDIGFTSPLIMSASDVPIEDKEFNAILDPLGAKFVSVTYRLFKPKSSSKWEKNGNLKFIGDGNFKIDCYNNVNKGDTIKLTPEIFRIMATSRYTKLFECSPSNEENKSDGKSSLLIDPFEFVKVNKCTTSCCGSKCC